MKAVDKQKIDNLKRYLCIKILLIPPSYKKKRKKNF